MFDYWLNCKLSRLSLAYLGFASKPLWFTLRSVEYFGIYRRGPIEVLPRHLSAGGTE
jgi:hypothetical protein